MDKSRSEVSEQEPPTSSLSNIFPAKNRKKGLNEEEISESLDILDQQYASNLSTTATTTTNTITTTTRATSKFPKSKMKQLGLSKTKKK